MMKIISVFTAAVFVLPFTALAAGTDTAAPVITLNGGSVTMNPGTSYSEPGYTATDINNSDANPANWTTTNLTSSVVVNNPVDTRQPGTYTLSYNVSDAANNPAVTKYRSVTVNPWAGISTPCLINGTCPCPIAADPISGDRAAWKTCAMARYPKLSDGSTLVCRLTPVMYGEAPKCASDQAGFGELRILPNGTEKSL